MNELEKAMQQLKQYTNQGYQVEQIECAALMVIAQSLTKIAEGMPRGTTG